MILALSIAAMACFAFGGVIAMLGLRIERLRKSSLQYVAAILGFVLKTLAIGLSCSIAETHFFNSSAEIMGLLAWSLAFSYVLSLRVFRAHSLGAISLPPVALLLAVSLFRATESPDPGVSSGWLLASHILSAFLGYGLFLTACASSILYLTQSHLLKRKTFGPLFRDLPGLPRLEALAILCVWTGFAFLTLTVFTGSSMASALHKPFWLDPKAVGTQATWLVFAVLIVIRVVRRLQGRTAAWSVLMGALFVIVTFVLSHPFGRPPQAAGAVKDAAVQQEKLPAGRSWSEPVLKLERQNA